jgi:hypothetical protein
MQTTQANLEKMESQLTQWGAKLKEANETAAKVGASAPKDHAQHITDLKSAHHTAQAKWDEYKKAGLDQWDKFRTGVETAWTAAESAASRINN